MSPSQIQPQDTRINLPRFLQADYKRSCIHGKWVALAGELQDAQLPTPPARIADADPPARGGSRYTVRSGDTLYAIARRFHCDDVRELVRGNRLHSASDLQVGKRLRLVGCKH
jgi:membrane-bound lytic murein transglycosylase D